MDVPRKFTMLGTSEIEVLLGAADSGGAMSIIAETCGPGAGPPPHIHSREDEFLLPLDGPFDCFDGTDWRTMPAGGLFTPRGRTHTWRMTGDGRGRLLTVTTPGGFEAFMYALRDVLLPRDLPRLFAISAGHGVSYPPPEPRS